VSTASTLSTEEDTESEDETSTSQSGNDKLTASGSESGNSDHDSHIARSAHHGRRHGGSSSRQREREKERQRDQEDRRRRDGKTENSSRRREFVCFFRGSSIHAHICQQLHLYITPQYKHTFTYTYIYIQEYAYVNEFYFLTMQARAVARLAGARTKTPTKGSIPISTVLQARLQMIAQRIMHIHMNWARMRWRCYPALQTLRCKERFVFLMLWLRLAYLSRVVMAAAMEEEIKKTLEEVVSKVRQSSCIKLASV